MTNQQRFGTALALALSMAAPAVYADSGPKVDIPGRARGAGKVVVARALTVTPHWRTNDHGDQLIVSLVELQVEETLKGESGGLMYLEVEGGTLDGVTLRVSSIQEVTAGERAVFFLDESASGVQLPHLKGKGILKLDQQNQIPSENLRLEDVRRLVRGAGK